MTALYNGLRVQNHVSKEAARTFFAWTNLAATESGWSERSFIGWDAEAHADNDDEVFFYLVPDFTTSTLTVHLYMGRFGDPAQDQLMGTATWIGDGLDG